MRRTPKRVESLFKSGRQPRPLFRNPTAAERTKYAQLLAAFNKRMEVQRILVTNPPIEIRGKKVSVKFNWKDPFFRNRNEINLQEAIRSFLRSVSSKTVQSKETKVLGEKSRRLAKGESVQLELVSLDPRVAPHFAGIQRFFKKREMER